MPKIPASQLKMRQTRKERVDALISRAVISKVDNIYPIPPAASAPHANSEVPASWPRGIQVVNDFGGMNPFGLRFQFHGFRLVTTVHARANDHESLINIFLFGLP